MSFILGLAVISYAQQGSDNKSAKTVRTPEDRATIFTKWIDKTVTLTPDQQTKVQAVNLKYANMKQAVRDSAQANRKAMRQEVMADNKEQDAELKSILTSDQYIAYTAARKQKMEDMRSKRKRNKH